MPEPGEFVGPAANRYESLGHLVEETRIRGTFEVRDGSRQLIGWIIRKQGRFIARGTAANIESSAELGAFHSGRAALRLVIGFREYDAIRRTAREHAAKLERDYLTAHPEITATAAPITALQRGGASRPRPGSPGSR